MNKKELPIGTVVMLVGGSKKVMITGYRSKNADADKVFDYNGCVFPEGLMENIYCLFDASQIEDVLYMGLENEEKAEHMNKIYNNQALTDKGMKNFEDEGDRKISPKGRIPKAPTNPMSKEEMKARFTVPQQSGLKEVDGSML